MNSMNFDSKPVILNNDNDPSEKRQAMKKPYDDVIKSLYEQRDSLIKRLPNIEANILLAEHTGILDDYFRDSFEKSLIGPEMGINKNPYVIIAQGGYGRGEQCIHSDVDLLFLFKHHVPPVAEDLIREIVYPLWDIGLEVGYATRSIEECLNLANDDYDILTPLLDARFICGMSILYSDLLEEIRQRIILKKEEEIIRWLVEKNMDRHRYFGDSSYLLEPNLKEGQGGLRDYHTLLWIQRIKNNIKHPRDMEYQGIISHRDYEALRNSLNFIWDIRNRLHLITGRKCDQLYTTHQIQMAKEMSFEKGKMRLPVEIFLGELHRRMEFIKQQLQIHLYELGYNISVLVGSVQNRKGIFRRKIKGRTKIDGIELDNDMIAFESSEAILKNPDLLIQIYEESSRLRIPLNAESKRLVREFLFLVNESFRKRETVVKAFETILTTKSVEFNVLNEMLYTGFLEKMIPEFSRLVNRIQYNDYHIYPVDKHSLRTVRILKNLPEADSEDSLLSNLYNECKQRKALLWAALLHDIGKGYSSENHADAGAEKVYEILMRLNIRQKDIDTAVFLVKEHLFLIIAATRRDTNDEETAIYCAKRINDISRLKMLYLLTVADSMSTGPKAWNEWTASLLRDLFFKILNILERGELASKEAVKIAEKKKEKILQSVINPWERNDIESLFNFMSPRYLLYAPTEDIQHHFQLYNKLVEAGNVPYVWNVKETKRADTRIVTICAKDRPGLFSKIAGVFALNHIDILRAHIFTWRNNTALDIFEVTPPPDLLFEDEKWEKAGRQLHDALNGRIDLAVEIKRKGRHKKSKKDTSKDIHEREDQVIINNQVSSFFTIIDIIANDYPGLLFTITNELFKLQLDIWVAKIATKIDQIVDVFYVRDFDGQKIDSEEQMKKIVDSIKSVIQLNREQ